MEKVIVASLRGIVCLLTLTGLAACNDGEGNSNTAAPTGLGQPQGSSANTDTGNTPPPVVSHPTQPTQPTEPSTPPGTPSDPDDDASEPSVPPQAANVAPQIAGSPATEVAVGQAFNFTPSATDADGDSLTFSIDSKPGWASFDANTGRLWGTPTNADVGSHEQIVISVSDGANTRALPGFTVSVVQQSNGSAALAWDPPTQNTDGSALTNLKGYKIHYGTQSGQYDATVTVNNAGVTSYVIENLAPGTYFFAISAITTSGVESEMSAEADKTI